MTEQLLNIPPGLFLVANALLACLFRRPAQRAWLIFVPLLTLGLVWQYPEGHSVNISWLGMSLTPLLPTATGLAFVTAFLLLLITANLFSFRQKNSAEIIAANIYAGSAIGVCLAGDLVSLFVFWEIMAISSTLVISSNRTEESGKAAFRYLVMHLVGGILLLTGLAGMYTAGSDMAIGSLSTNSIPAILVLLALLLNAGAPPVSAWLPDAYPAASHTGSVYLSAFTTKTAVYVLLTAFPGENALIYAGLYMVFYGIIYAIRESDIRRMLSYSIISQVGFMLVGIGIGTPLALAGVILHAFSHIIYKGLMMMTAGTVMLQTGERRFGSSGKLYRKMPVTTACALVGAASISALPLTSGFISKSMISASATESSLTIIWLLLMSASALTFFYAGMKFAWLGFFNNGNGTEAKDPATSMKAAMLILSLLCILPGLYPGWLFQLLPETVTYQTYTISHVLSQLALLAVTALAFILLKNLVSRTVPVSMDTDWLWRRGLPAITALAENMLARLYRLLAGMGRQALQQAGEFSRMLFHERGKLVSTLTHGKAVLWLATIFFLLLIMFVARFFID